MRAQSIYTHLNKTKRMYGAITLGRDWLLADLGPETQLVLLTGCSPETMPRRDRLISKNTAD